MLGIVLACEVPLAIRVGAALLLLLLLLLCSAPSFDGGGVGVGVRESEMMRLLWSCANGEGAIRRGSIFDIGGVEEAFRG